MSDSWSTGKRRDIHPGDRFFILRQAMEPRGLIASGFVASECYDDQHFDKPSQMSPHVKVTFDTVLVLDEILKREELARLPIPRATWATRVAGIEIHEPAAGALEDLWKDHRFQLGLPLWDAEQEAPKFSGLEGREKERLHKFKERNPKVVREKKAFALRMTGELCCEVCNFTFADQYGAAGSNYIECHHRLLHANLEANHQTTLDELALVCANCHRMLHAADPPITVEELRMIVEVQSSKSSLP